MSRDFQDRGRTLDSTFAAPAKQRHQHEPTRAEKAHAAESIARNLDHAHAAVVETLEVLAHAHGARDVAGYMKARGSAEHAIEHIRALAQGAVDHAADATDSRVRAKLEQAAALAEVAARNLASAPAAPQPVAPTLRNEAALLDALPPTQIQGPSKPIFDAARQRTRSALSQLPYSDFAALDKILAEFPRHEIAVRFRKFTSETQRQLTAILQDPKVRVRARAMEASMPSIAPPPPAFAAPKPAALISPPPAFQSEAVAVSDAQGGDAAAAVPASSQKLPDGIRGELEHATERSLDHVRVHAGAAGSAVAAKHGARAVAIGRDIHFNEGQLDPTSGEGRELIAHEVGHVLQADASPGPSTVAAKRAHGGDENAAEADADQFAATFRSNGATTKWKPSVTVSGASPLRAPATSPTSGAERSAQAEAFAPSEQLSRYVRIHAVDLGLAIRRQLANTIWPDPTEDTPFTRPGERRFSQRLSALMRDQLDQPEHLVMMLYPGNALERFQQYVVAPGLLNNLAYRGFGEPLAQLVELAAKESLTKRVGPRYAKLLSQMVRKPTADDIIAGHPIDPIIAAAICEDGILEANVAAVKDIGPDKVNHVDVHWLGRQSADLWNFVQAAPSTATPEEVAATLWGDPQKTTMAFAVEKYGDVFRVAPGYARQVLAGRYPSEPIGTTDVDASRAKQMVALARSTVRHGEAPTAEFTHEQQTKSVTAEQLAEVETHVGALLDQIANQLARVAMDKLVQPAIAARQGRANTLTTADAAARSHWLPVLSFQHTQLLTINAQLPAAVQAYQKVFAVLPFGDQSRRRAHDDAESLVRDYAAAAGTSHLRDESNAIMQRIEQRQQAAAQNQLDATAVELHDATTSNVDSGGRTMRGNADAEHDIEQQRQVAQNKGKTSQYDRRKALVVAGEHALLARMDSAQRSLLQLQEAADSAGFADGDALRKILHNATIKSFPEVITDVRDHLAEVQRVWDATIADPKNRPEVIEEGAPAEWDDWQAREVALPIARSEFAKIAGDQALGEFIREAVKKIQVQRIINALTTLAEALLLTVAAGAGAASIARAAASLVAEQGTLVFAGVEIAANASINSLVQMAVSGDGNASFGWTMLENGLMDMFTRGLLRPMKNAENAARAEVREIAVLPHLSEAERAAASSASFMGLQPVAELVGGMASQWAARHIVDLAKSKLGAGGARDEGVSDSFALTALQQGAAIGLGKFFHGRLGAWQAHRAQLEQTRIGGLPEARALFAAREQFFLDATRVETSPSPDPAEVERLNQRNLELEHQERKLFEVGAPPKIDGVSTENRASDASSSVDPSTTSKKAAARTEESPTSAEESADSEVTRAGHERAAQNDRGAAQTSETSVEHAPPASELKPQSPGAKWQLALDHIVGDRVPSSDLLPDTSGNRDGLKRLADIHNDQAIPPAVRQAFMQEFAGELRGLKSPPENLLKVMKDIVYSQEGAAKYQRKGTKIPDLAYVRDTLGGLRRCLSLRSLCAPGTLSPEFYQHVLDVNEKLDGKPLPEYTQLSWMKGAEEVVALIKSGAVDFDPNRDLMPTGMIKGMNANDSGWFFAGHDADVSDVRSAQSQLAISGAYLDGYVVVDIPFEMALANEQTGHAGASRPTALDLTLDPMGKLNPDASEPVGRTNPQSPGQVSAREVVLPPIPLSTTTKRTYVRAGAK